MIEVSFHLNHVLKMSSELILSMQHNFLHQLGCVRGIWLIQKKVLAFFSFMKQISTEQQEQQAAKVIRRQCFDLAMLV